MSIFTFQNHLLRWFIWYALYSLAVLYLFVSNLYLRFLIYFDICILTQKQEKLKFFLLLHKRFTLYFLVYSYSSAGATRYFPVKHASQYSVHPSINSWRRSPSKYPKESASIILQISSVV